MRVSVYIATSLDGFIARENGDLDWLGGSSEEVDTKDQNRDAENRSEDYGYEAFVNRVDALVMGRNTYEKVLSFGSWPYSKPVIVLSSRSLDIPAYLSDSVEAMSGSPEDVVTRLSGRGIEHLYVDGGVTVQRFLRAGLIQRLIITRVPILIGTGIPLFGSLPEDIKLKHIRTQSYPSGFVQSEYRVL